MSTNIMAKRACFLLLLFAAFEVLALIEDNNNELLKIEMPRKVFPNAEIVTTIIESFDESVGCVPLGGRCRIPRRCCNPYYCTNPITEGVCK